MTRPACRVALVGLRGWNFGCDAPRRTYLNESAAELVAAGYDPAEEFSFGLDLVLAALEPMRDRAKG